MKRRLLIIVLIATFCLNGCSRNIEPMVEDEVGKTEIKLSDEQLEFLANIAGPVLPNRVIRPWLN